MASRQLFTSAIATMALAVTGCFGVALATADDGDIGPGPGPTGGGEPVRGTPGNAYAMGGARVLGIPYDEYIRRTGVDWFPGLNRQNIDYPAGQVQGHTLERILPGIGAWGESVYPGLGLDGPSIGESVDVGEVNLVNAIREGGPGTTMGLSEGALVLNAVKAQLADDPNAPPPDQLSFATYGDPIAKHPFGESFLTQVFPVGSVVPSMDYRIPAPVESQYDTYQFIAPYDAIADWPDRPDNWLSLINSMAGLATGHTAVAFTDPSMVPAQNIRTEVNSRGAETTTYMIPQEHLPLVLPFKYLGVPKETLNELDAVLKPMVDAGYSRNDNPATAPDTVDPVNGFDPAEITAPASHAAFGAESTDPLEQFLSGVEFVLGR